MQWAQEGIRLEILQGDLTMQDVDAIVNAANSMLAHGGGLAGIISRRGGAVIDSESKDWIAKYGSVSHSNPAFTHAGNLPCKYVIHAVGPIWGDGDEEGKLAICTSACLALAEKLKLTSIAFPAISTGIYRVPFEAAARGMLLPIRRYMEAKIPGQIEEIRVVLYTKDALDVFVNVQKRLVGEG